MELLRPWTPTRLVAAVILAGLAVRLALAGTIGLGVDESYMVAVARRFSLGYFDHPPLSFWLAGAIAKLTGSEARLVVRLPFVLLFAGTTWIMYRLAARLFGEWAGAWAATLLNLSPVFSVSTGGWVLPDGPLMLFLVGAAYCLARALAPDQTPPAAGTRWWLGAGTLGGLALLSKYHGAFLGLGALLFLATCPGRRHRLRRPGPYLAAAIALAIFLPVVIWNAQHDWASFRYQAGRGLPVRGLDLGSLLANVGGQALYVLPWIWLPLLWELIAGLRAGPGHQRRWLLCCVAVGPIAAFTLVALGGRVGLPHWQAPGYLLLFPLLGASVAARLARGDAAVRRWLIASVVAFPLLLAAAATHTATGWMSRVAPGLLGRGDPSLEALDWRDLGPALRDRGLLEEPGRFVAATRWIEAGKIAYALGPGVPVLCLCAAPHHFAFLEDQRAFLGRDAVLIERSGSERVADAYLPYFDSVRRLGTVPIRRGGRPGLEVDLYLARGFRRTFPAGGS